MIQGNADRILPITASGLRAAKLIKGAPAAKRGCVINLQVFGPGKINMKLSSLDVQTKSGVVHINISGPLATYKRRPSDLSHVADQADGTKRATGARSTISFSRAGKTRIEECEGHHQDNVYG